MPDCYLLGKDYAFFKYKTLLEKVAKEGESPVKKKV